LKEYGGIYGVLHPDGILTNPGDGPAYRIAGAQQMKARGLRIIGGKFKEKDSLECVRTGIMISTATKDGIMVLETKGGATDIEGCIVLTF